MKLKEFMEEMKASKNRYINIYFLSSRTEKKGVLKNTTGNLEDEGEKFIDISIKEIKSDEEMLKEYKCGGCGKGKKDRAGKEKDRVIISIKDLDEATTIEKSKKMKSDLYKIVVNEEEIGIVIYD
ncbi:hypothetical protein [uncultured Ilyobacter sp.]|uniref:hypothetical protein n=1 Tax=uncultured Ilyobacter sp. TaxID=544433 RepID=UPI0029F535BD|nr:hypothetical protein [uncultured Ilyobacter sp.]